MICVLSVSVICEYLCETIRGQATPKTQKSEQSQKHKNTKTLKHKNTYPPPKTQKHLNT